jgi:hypothetical protein
MEVVHGRRAGHDQPVTLDDLLAGACLHPDTLETRRKAVTSVLSSTYR